MIAEAPREDRDGEVVRERSFGRAFEIEERCDPFALPEDVVAKEIAMDQSARKIPCPLRHPAIERGHEILRGFAKSRIVDPKEPATNVLDTKATFADRHPITRGVQFRERRSHP